MKPKNIIASIVIILSAAYLVYGSFKIYNAPPKQPSRIEDPKTKEANNLFHQARDYGTGRNPDIPKDLNKAIELYTKSAELGDERAMNNLSVLYLMHKEEISEDYLEKSEYWARKMLAVDPDDAIIHIALIEDEKGNHEEYKRLVEEAVKKDIATAYRLKAFIEKDHISEDEFINLLKTASNKGDDNATITLIDVLYKAKRYKEMLPYFDIVPSYNVEYIATHNLLRGFMYEHGKGYPQDTSKAREYYELCLDQNIQCNFYLGALAYKEKNYTAARKLLTPIQEDFPNAKDYIQAMDKIGAGHLKGD